MLTQADYDRLVPPVSALETAVADFKSAAGATFPDGAPLMPVVSVLEADVAEFRATLALLKPPPRESPAFGASQVQTLLINSPPRLRAALILLLQR